MSRNLKLVIVLSRLLKPKASRETKVDQVGWPNLCSAISPIIKLEARHQTALRIITLSSLRIQRAPCPEATKILLGVD